jgi:ribosomal protein S18 acetylase RimI-like enzyme
MENGPFEIRLARPEELAALVPSSPTRTPRFRACRARREQPGYYAMVRDAAARAKNPAIRIVAAVATRRRAARERRLHRGDGAATGREERLGPARHAGIRLLAVAPPPGGTGIGRALTRTASSGPRRSAEILALVLHTTRAMETAWRMYEQLGFRRSPDLDFRQGNARGVRLRASARRDANLQTDAVEPSAV